MCAKGGHCLLRRDGACRGEMLCAEEGCSRPTHTCSRLSMHYVAQGVIHTSAWGQGLRGHHDESPSMSDCVTGRVDKRGVVSHASCLRETCEALCEQSGL
jgi:hypothetical protein